jgi:hypothetical protein
MFVGFAPGWKVGRSELSVGHQKKTTTTSHSKSVQAELPWGYWVQSDFLMKYAFSVIQFTILKLKINQPNANSGIHTRTCIWLFIASKLTSILILFFSIIRQD